MHGSRPICMPATRRAAVAHGGNAASPSSVRRWSLCTGVLRGVLTCVRETLALVPKSRVRGYLNVPLVPTLIWRRAGHADAQVCELLPNSLTAEWEESSSLVVQRVVSPVFQC